MDFSLRYSSSPHRKFLHYEYCMSQRPQGSETLGSEGVPPAMALACLKRGAA
jgi:hypothetical protein